MVLKRLLVSALGALGLSAMVAGPAFADDAPGVEGIPAPNVFNGVVACGGGTLPASVTMTRSMGTVQSILDDAFDYNPGAFADINAAAANLTADEVAALNGTVTPCASDPVGGGFARAVLLYNQVVAAEAALPAAGAPSNPTLTKAYNDAVAAFEAYSGTSLGDGSIGSVYDAVYSERAALAVLTTAISNYNVHVGDNSDYATAWTSYNGVDLTTMTTSLYGSMGIQGFEEISGTGINLDGTAFSTAGVLLTTGTASGSITTIGGVIGQLNTEQAALDAAQDVLDAAIKAGSPADTISDRTAERDRWEDRRDHVARELSRLLGIARLDTANDATHGAFIRAYDNAESKRSVLEQSVRSTAAALEMARGTVHDTLGGAGDYLAQLVTLRQWEYDNASAADQANPRSAVNTNLADAKAQQTTYTGLVANPTSTAGKLLDALLEPDNLANGNPNPDDDDGLALVSAIAEVDGKIADLDDLTGPGGEVTMNTANIATNTTNIATNTANIATNTADIATNKGMIATNTADIATNKGMIATNMADIATNKGMIETNTAGIGANTSAIADNANAIGSNSAAIQRNSGMIGELSESLETVRAGVAASMALAGMPAINGRGISIGVGSFDGESAFAVGFMIQGEMASFKVGVTSAGGATGASAGVGFQF